MIFDICTPKYKTSLKKYSVLCKQKVGQLLILLYILTIEKISLYHIFPTMDRLPRPEKNIPLKHINLQKPRLLHNPFVDIY